VGANLSDGKERRIGEVAEGDAIGNTRGTNTELWLRNYRNCGLVVRIGGVISVRPEKIYEGGGP
jgi:hypothetical protein